MPKILSFKKNAKLLIAWGGVFFWISSSFSSPSEDFQRWKFLYEEQASFREITAFLEKHPDWPSQKTLIKKAEKNLDGKESSTFIIPWFQKHPPVTAEGAFAYAKALMKAGQTPEAKNIIKKAWREFEFSSDSLKTFYQHFGQFLTSEDTEKRASYFLYKEDRQAVEALFPYLTQHQKDTVNVRLAFLSLQEDAKAKLENHRIFAKDNPALVYEQIKWYRRRNLYPEALALLEQSFPEEEKKFAEFWWTERNRLARHYIENKHYRQAFAILQQHRLKEGENFVHASWMMGWLQLRFLNQPRRAFEQFKKVYPLVKTPQSQSRFAFWAGEAAKNLGLKIESINWYQKASLHPGTFYGQLAISRLRTFAEHGRRLILSFPQSLSVSTELKKSFNNRPLVKVLKNLQGEDQDKYKFFFLFKLTELIHDPKEHHLLVELAHHVGGPYATVESSREIAKKHYLLTELSYPSLMTGNHKRLLEKVSGSRSLFSSLVHAIIRQESRFNPKAESCAQAMGLMQIRPSTAAEHERNLKSYGVTVPLTASLFHPEKNLALGSAHLDHLVQEFQGNLILVIAAYNAGTGNVRKWLQALGDPRETKMSWLDWIELIPYYETRNYVQRVLENLMVYQFRLSPANKPCYDLAQLLSLRLEALSQ